MQNKKKAHFEMCLCNPLGSWVYQSYWWMLYDIEQVTGVFGVSI